MTEQINPTPEMTQEAPKKNRTWLVILLIVIAILLCCCVVVVISTFVFGGTFATEVWEQVQATLTAMPATY